MKLLHYTRPGIPTVIHACRQKMHFQGHSVQCVTVLKDQDATLVPLHQRPRKHSPLCGSLQCQGKQSRGLNLSRLNPVSGKNSPSVTKPGPQRRHLQWVRTRSLSPGEPALTNLLTTVITIDSDRQTDTCIFKHWQGQTRREGGWWTGQCGGRQMRDDGYDWLQMRETATSSFPHTVSPLATTRLSPRVWRSHCTPPLLPFSVQKRTTTSAVHSPFPSPFTPISLTPLLCPPFFSSSVRTACITFSPGYVEWTERAEQWLPFSLTAQHGGVGGGVYWLLVFF